MRIYRLAGLLFVAAFFAGCGSDESGTGGDFRLVEFLDAGKKGIARNRTLVFKFSQPVKENQDFAERLKVQNIQTGGGQSDFSRAQGAYLVNGEIVTFQPQLPEKPDRSDAGFRSLGNYHVFLKGGGDSLESDAGDRITTPQEMLFDTSEYFEDPDPTHPPRVVHMVARDITDDSTVDISRLDPRPDILATLDNKTLVDNDRIIEPGAGGPPNYSTSWQFELHISEPVDPQRVVRANVQMLEIRNDALTTEDSADEGWMGTATPPYRVPIEVKLSQRLNAECECEPFIIVRPLQTLVDDARYRIVFSGSILGIDFRKDFVGENGLTGDGETVIDEITGAVYPEPGGLGYTTEFVVYDRPAITTSRTVSYSPEIDGVYPETGQTTVEGDETLHNSSLYNPVENPGTALGFLSDFGDGSDGSLSVSGGQTAILDTGDEVNEAGNPFMVWDINPDDDYLGNPLPGRLVSYDRRLPFELNLDSFVVSSSSTLRVTGVNPLLIRVLGIVQISGSVDISGSNGGQGGGSQALAGIGGPAGFDGGSTKWGSGSCTNSFGSCSPMASYLNACASSKAGFPNSLNGTGPGRGYAGGDAYNYDFNDDRVSLSCTGGGGGSHGSLGQRGEDRLNASASTGSYGSTCSPTVYVYNSGVVGVRGMYGSTYGDREVADILLGGSGGGGGGSSFGWGGVPKNAAGGGGGGGGGSLSIYASGSILVIGGRIDATGGDGGIGAEAIYNASNNWVGLSGSGGGGSGGTVALISADAIELTASTLDATGGAGGPRPVVSSSTCNGCNAGGDGGKGYIFLMDKDGVIGGFLPGSEGNYDNYTYGVLTIRKFETSRFSSIAAVTELFGLPAADPTFLPLTAANVVANVNTGQAIDIFCSSAPASLSDPNAPSVEDETPLYHVATVRYSSGAIVVDDEDGGNMLALNTPERDVFVRIYAAFDYTNGVDAALGPFAWMDEFTVNIQFNGP